MGNMRSSDPRIKRGLQSSPTSLKIFFQIFGMRFFRLAHAWKPCLSVIICSASYNLMINSPWQLSHKFLHKYGIYWDATSTTFHREIEILKICRGWTDCFFCLICYGNFFFWGGGGVGVSESESIDKPSNYGRFSFFWPVRSARWDRWAKTVHS